jgi:flagellar export protein FliJ
MARFRFRLDRLLRLKGQLRRTVQEEVQLLQQEQQAVCDALAEAETTRDANRAAVVQAAAAGLSAADLRLYRDYDRAQAHAARTLGARADAIGAVIDGRREELITRRRDERRLETLEARLRQRHAAAEARADAHLSDDLVRRPATGMRAASGRRPDGEPGGPPAGGSPGGQPGRT